MAKVISNIKIDERYYVMQTDFKADILPGQFFMVRGWEKTPILSRPLSIFDNNEHGAVFLYEVVGEGTRLLSLLREGDEVQVTGPLGNSFPMPERGRLTLVGGGVGIAPFYYTAKVFKRENPDLDIKIYLGLREESQAEKLFMDLDVELIVKKGGFVTDAIDFENEKLIYTCGPKIMMEKVVKLGKEKGSEVYVSLDEVMACGVGACLGCTCKSKNGNVRVCKEGPVFRGEEIYYE